MSKVLHPLRSVMLLLVMTLLTQVGWGQPWTYDFGTGTGTHTSTTASTSFLPTPTSGTARVRVGNNPGSITLANPGIANLGSGSQLQITSNTSSTSTTKFSVYDYTARKTGYLKFKIAFSGGTNGVYQLAIGDGATFSDNVLMATTQIFAGVRWSLGASNAITYNVLSGSDYVTTGISNSTTLFSQSTSNTYTVEAYFNNTTTSTNYSRAGISYSLASTKWDLWVDGTRQGSGLAKGGITADVDIDSYSFNHQFSATAPGTIYLDNIEYSNSLPTPTISSSGTLSAVNTTYGSASASPSSFTVSGSNMTAGITVTPPAGFEVSTLSDFSSSVGDNSSALTVGSSGTIASTTVYVRLKASATVAGSPYSGNIVLSSSGATSVNVATASSTVTAKTLTITGLSATDKDYDGTTTVSVTGTPAYSGLANSESFAVTGTVTWAFPDANVGANKTLTRTGSYNAPSSNYTVTQPSLNASINAVVPGAPTISSVTAGDAQLTVAFTAPASNGGVTISNYEYSTNDGSSWVTPSPANTSSPFVISGLINGNTYDIKIRAVNSVGSGSASTAVQGTPAAVSTPTIFAFGTLSAVSTTYGTASASPTSFNLSGSALTDDIVVTPPSGFEVSSGAGYSTSLTLTQSGGTVASTTIYVRLAATASVAGSPYSGNIVLSSTGATSQNVATVSSTISAKGLTITDLTGSNKEYDRTTPASFTGTAAYSGLANSESFSVSGTPTASFATASVGTNKTITISGYTAPSSNYSLTQPTLTADITAKALTISSAAASTKTYDGNTNATLTGSLSGVISGDAVTLSGTGTFDSPNAGTGIAVTSTATLTGADAGNYSLTQPTGLTANIDKANQTITFGALPSKTTADADFAPGATSATSGVNAITYSSSNTAVATIVAGNIDIVGLGTSVITASQAASDNYNAAADVNQTLTVSAITTIAAWNFFGISSPATATATTFNSNLVSTSSANDITRGSGAALSSGSNSFRTTGFQNNGISTANTDYFQVTLGAKSGYKLSLRTIDARFLGTPAFFALPGVTSQFAYSLDGTNFTLIGSAVQSTSLTMAQIDVSGVSALQGISAETTVTIRYYASGQTTTGGWGFSSPSALASDDGLAFRGFVEAPAAPTLTAAPSATVDNDFNITFSDDATWRAAVTSVKYGSNTLTPSTDYTLSAGTLTLKPIGSAGSGLRTSGTQTVTVLATNYTDATVSQAIDAGAATKLLIATQPTAPLNNGEVLATQPVVRVADQYDNTTTSTATVDASVGSGTWTLGGTSSPAAVSGTATFTNLTATSAAAVTGATISFASTGLTGATSSTFNIPAPPRAEPSENPTSFAAVLGSPSYSAINLSWTDAGGSVLPDGYLIKGSTVSFASITEPIDETPVSDAGLNKNIVQGVQAAAYTGLASNTTYYFKIYSYTNAGSLINYKLDGVIQQSSATTDRSTNSTDYFRSKASGVWATAGTWESSNDGTNNWITATAVPSSVATAITVQNGHTVTIGTAVTLDKTTIADGGILKLVNDGAVTQSGAITLATGATDQLTIQSGGTLQVVVSSSSATYNYATLISYQTSGNINVNSGGKISVGDGSTTHIGSDYGGFGLESSTKVTWSDGSIFEWNSTALPIPSTSGQTFFPGVIASVVPILRITAIGGTPGGGSATIVNGRLEPNTNITWTGTGAKTFRNGISGSGNVVQSSTCGQFILSGTAQIGGSGVLTLNVNDLSVTGTATLVSNKQIDMEAGTTTSIITVSGTLDLAGYVLSGTSAVTLTGTFKTSHADGIVGSLTNSGTNTLTGGTVDHTAASAQNISVGNYGSITNTGGGARTFGAGTTKIAGSFTTGAGNYTIGTSTVEFNGSAAQTIPVIPVESGSNYYNLVHSGTNSATLAGSISVANDVTLSGTNANSRLSLTDATARTLTINGNLILTDGTLDFAATGASATGIVELKGNLSQTAGITYTTAALTNGQIYFSGSGTTSTPQTLTLTSTNTFQYTNLVVNSGTAVQVNSNFILSGSSDPLYTGTLTVNGILNLQGRSITSSGASGSNNATFVLSSGATLISSSTTGLSGAIPASFMTRTFNSAANYEFSGSVAITNSNFSNTTMNNLTISNTAGVTLGSSATINGILDLSGGKLAIGSNTLALSGTVSSMTTTKCLTGSANSNLSITGTGPLGTLYFDQTTPGTTDNVATLTMNRTSSGSVILGSNAKIGTSLILTAGTLDLSNNSLTYSGSSLTRTIGNLDVDAGSLAFTNTTGLTLPASVFTGSINNLTLNGAGGVVLSSDATVSGDLTLTAGTLDLGVNSLSYSGSSITRTSGAIDVDAGGISFANATAVSLPASVFSGFVNNWTMNGVGGVTIAGNQTISGLLTLTSGNLSVGNNTLTLSGSLSNGSANSYIKSNGTGKLVRTSISAATLFPVGNAKYNPLTINNANGLNWSVNATDGLTTENGFSTAGAVLMTWDITPSTNPPSSATSITFQYDGTSQVGANYSSINANMQAFHRNRYDEYWLPTGSTATADETTPSATTVTISGLTSFSKYALSKVGSPLPVSLLSFSGYKDGMRNQLRWVTATEINNSGFQVERSSDGQSYQSIGFVNSLAIGGNSQAQLKYSFIDVNPNGIKHYYRLKQMDIDGRSSLSNILLIQGEKPTAFEIASVFPNPSRGQITLLISAPNNENITFRLFDMSGRIIESRQANLLTGNNSISFDLSKQAKGQYLIQVGEKSVRVVRE